MFGQNEFRYELYSIGQDIELNLSMIDKQHIQPQIIMKKGNYVIYEYYAENSVKLDTLLDSLPFIAVSLNQIVLIIKEICLKLKEFQTQNLAIKNISYKNILIHVDSQFTYYELKTYKIKVDIIGIEFSKNIKADKFKLFNQTKRLVSSILNLYEQKYVKQPRGISISQEWNEFHKGLFQDDDFGQFLGQYLKSKASDAVQIRFQYERDIQLPNKQDYFQTQTIVDFENLLKKELKSFEEALELQPSLLNKLITSLLINKCYVMFYDSIDQYLLSNYRYISYYYIKDIQAQVSNEFNELLSKLKQKYNFNALFQQEFENNISLNNHFKRFYNLQKDWFKCLGLNNLMPEYLLIAAQANCLNNYVAFKQVLDHLQQYPLKQDIIEFVDNTCDPFDTKIFEPYLISKLQDFISYNINNLFEQQKNKIIQEIEIKQEDQLE